MTETRVLPYPQSVTIGSGYAWVVDKDHRVDAGRRFRDFRDSGEDDPRPGEPGDSYRSERISPNRPTWGPPEAPADLLDVLVHARYNGWQWRLRGATPDCELLYSGRIRFADISLSPLDAYPRAAMSPLQEFGKLNGASLLEYKIDASWVRLASGNRSHE